MVNGLGYLYVAYSETSLAVVKQKKIGNAVMVLKI